jgi:methylated-DNA-[protein]-cysteine S-methyltransferase
VWWYVVVGPGEHTGLVIEADIAVGSLDTQVGRLSVAVSDVGLIAVGWGEPARLLARPGLVSGVGQPPRSTDPTEQLARTRPVLRQLAEYFAGTRREFDLVLDWRLTTGSTQSVLRTLHDTVGFGQAITYGRLAARSGSGVPARGIGAIMGSNPLPIVVGCHRVLAATGLGGYSGGHRETPGERRPGSSRYGLETKRWLLTFEEILPPTLGWDPAARLDLDDSRPLSG